MIPCLITYTNDNLQLPKSLCSIVYFALSFQLICPIYNMVSLFRWARQIGSKSFGTDGVVDRLLCPLSFDTAIRLNGELIVDTCQSGLEVYLMISSRKLVCGDGEQSGIVFESVCLQFSSLHYRCIPVRRLCYAV